MTTKKKDQHKLPNSSFRLPVELNAEFDALAKQKGLTRTQAIIEAINLWLFDHHCGD